MRWKASCLGTPNRRSRGTLTLMETVTASHASERCFQTCTRLSSRVVKKHANDVVTWLHLPVVSADHVSASTNARHVQRCAHPRTLRYVSIATMPLHCGAGIVSMVTRLPSSSVDNVEKKLANVVVTSLNLPVVSANHVSANTNARHVQRSAHPRTLYYVSIATMPLHCGARIAATVTRLASSSVDNVEKKLANDVVTWLHLPMVSADHVSARSPSLLSSSASS